ncbi:MAG: methyltransferase domain-containing protein [Candidatus Lokiarchaeota archaeon]|nr:methyltransferase domain-containing protein [Candidatus Lokiarchaeota archaeon]
MAVTYMRKLEEEPKDYDKGFTKLTKGININVQDWILSKLKKLDNVIEMGSGPGTLAKKIANKVKKITAFDNNANMIDYAQKNYKNNKNTNLTYQISSYKNLPVDLNSQDVIVTTFMLSELRPLEQQIFLRNSWNILKHNGRLLIAAEFIPNGFWKLIFNINRWRYKKKLKRLRLDETHVLKHFFNYLEPIGFKIIDKKIWKHGTIQVIELQKTNNNSNNPGYYNPPQKNYKGIKAQFRIYRCIFTGQSDRVPIEPGVYKSGNPNKNSPIIISCNYEFTYIKLMRDLRGIDAWVLCIDSNGINVWCAARGDDFGNEQLLEALEATGIHNYIKTKKLILPQLSAGGIAIPQLPKFSEDFPFKIKYGPVWSKHLKQYLDDGKKSEEMKRAKFTLFHRVRAGFTHISFLFRKIFILPLIGLIILNFIFTWLNMFNKILWIVDFIIAIGLSNLLLILIFPLSKFTRKFLIKGVFFGTINLILMGCIIWIQNYSLEYILLNLTLFFWVSFFSTMSFSGNTMSTNPREIQSEYPIFKKINEVLMIIAIILSGISLLFY